MHLLRPIATSATEFLNKYPCKCRPRTDHDPQRDANRCPKSRDSSSLTAE